MIGNVGDGNPTWQIRMPFSFGKKNLKWFNYTHSPRVPPWGYPAAAHEAARSSHAASAL